MLQNNDNMTRRMLKIIRESSNKQGLLIKEDIGGENGQGNENNESNVVPITNDVRFGGNALTQQEEAFRNAVDMSAQFAAVNENDPDSSPLVYFKDTGNVVMGGTIPALNNMKFQFSLQDSDGTGCFIWLDGGRLTEDNLITLKKLHAYYESWRNTMEKNDELLSNLKNND